MDQWCSQGSAGHSYEVVSHSLIHQWSWVNLNERLCCSAYFQTHRQRECREAVLTLEYFFFQILTYQNCPRHFSIPFPRRNTSPSPGLQSSLPKGYRAPLSALSIFISSIPENWCNFLLCSLNKLQNLTIPWVRESPTVATGQRRLRQLCPNAVKCILLGTIPVISKCPSIYTDEVSKAHDSSYPVLNS